MSEAQFLHLRNGHNYSCPKDHSEHEMTCWCPEILIPSRLLSVSPVRASSEPGSPPPLDLTSPAPFLPALPSGRDQDWGIVYLRVET